MATSKINITAAYAQDTTHPIKFYKYGRVVMAILDANNITAEIDEPISDIPEAYLPKCSFTTKEDLYDVRLRFDASTKKVHTFQKLAGHNIRGIVTYIAETVNGA